MEIFPLKPLTEHISIFLFHFFDMCAMCFLFLLFHVLKLKIKCLKPTR